MVYISENCLLIDRYHETWSAIVPSHSSPLPEFELCLGQENGIWTETAIELRLL